MAKGHDNIAAIGSEKLNEKWGVSFKPLLRREDQHDEVAVLKDNLRMYRNGSTADWDSVPKLDGNNTPLFDADTEANVIRFQKLESLQADGIYGQASRNKMAAKIGKSSKGFVRLHPGDQSHYINYNDTPEGLRADSVYELDHSWVTAETLNVLEKLADQFYKERNIRLEINDCSLIDGANTPEHASHQSGRELDIRNAGFSAEDEKKFLEICLAEDMVEGVLFHTLHGLTGDKLRADACHKDHFHVVIVAQ